MRIITTLFCFLFCSIIVKADGLILQNDVEAQKELFKIIHCTETINDSLFVFATILTNGNTSELEAFQWAADALVCPFYSHSLQIQTTLATNIIL